MDKIPPFSVINRIKSFFFAGKGVAKMLIYEHNAWIHFAATIIVVSAGFHFRINRYDWCALALAIVAVWTAEALNTALELLCDVAVPDIHPLINQAKDVAAGAVLITAIGAVIIGALVFWPYVAVYFI
ncbi:MAG: diacylglycerol kinase family protein [Elusimicrobiota bacterium]